MERKRGLLFFPTPPRYVSRDFHVEPLGDEWPWWHLRFSVTAAEETQKGDEHFTCTHLIVPVYMTPYQLGINWSSWMLMGGEELFGCLCLLTALRSVTGTKRWLNQSRTVYWRSDFKTDLIQCHNQRQRHWKRQSNHGWRCKGADGKMQMWTETDKTMERRRRRSNTMNSFVFCSRQTTLTACWSLSSDSLTLEPQLAVLTCLHCLKSTFSVLTVSLILTNCTVVVAVHLHT